MGCESAVSERVTSDAKMGTALQYAGSSSTACPASEGASSGHVSPILFVSASSAVNSMLPLLYAFHVELRASWAAGSAAHMYPIS